MPDTDHSSADVLRELLVSATSSTIYLPGDRDQDPRRTVFNELVTVMDQALDGDVVLYATHSFEDAFRKMNSPLRGSVYAATSTLLLSAQVVDRQSFQPRHPPAPHDQRGHGVVLDTGGHLTSSGTRCGARAR